MAQSPWITQKAKSLPTTIESETGIMAIRDKSIKLRNIIDGKISVGIANLGSLVDELLELDAGSYAVGMELRVVLNTIIDDSMELKKLNLEVENRAKRLLGDI